MPNRVETGNKFGILQAPFDSLAHPIPTPYKRTEVNTFGGRFTWRKEMLDGMEILVLVYDTRGPILAKDFFNPSRYLDIFDQKSDSFVRATDDHVMRHPGRLLLTHPRWFFSQLFASPMRAKDPKRIMENVEKLGLSEFYAEHPWGIQILKPEIYTMGRNLHDIYRADLIDPLLTKIDRFQALVLATQYIKIMHKKHGSIGEVQPCRIQFRHIEGNGNVVDPVLTVPDVMYMKPVKVSDDSILKSEKATDILDFMASIGVEEYKRAQREKPNDPDYALNMLSYALKLIVYAYGDLEILKVVYSFAKRGRLVCDEQKYSPDKQPSSAIRNLFRTHNKVRLGIDEELSKHLRVRIISEINQYLITSGVY